MVFFSSADRGRPQISINVIVNVFDSLKPGHLYIHLQPDVAVSATMISPRGHIILHGHISVDHLIVVLAAWNKKLELKNLIDTA